MIFLPVIAQAEGIIQLPGTGQTKCYDEAGNEINCAGTGQDGELRAGAEWPNPRFISGTGDESDCMIDNLTGLMWPKDGNLAGVKYWNDAMDYANSLTLCGRSDWRLPNVNELETMVNAEQSNPAAWLNTQGFINVQSFSYWSSTTLADDTDKAWNIWNGFVFFLFNKDFILSVWPVRSEKTGIANIWQTGQIESYWQGDDGDLKKGVSWTPSTRFADHGNGEVTDNLTGLVWTKNTNAPGPSACVPGTTKTWQGALDYVKCLNTQNYLGHNDWRLPNRKEFISLIDRSQYDPALPQGNPFTGVQSNAYWSSTTHAYSTDEAWLVNMRLGYVFWNGKASFFYVWPVRSGQVDNLLNLVISKSGTGSGTVTSSPSGIPCGSACSSFFTSGTSVTLTAVADASSTFTGWSGDCSGTGTTCTVIMDASKNVTAIFDMSSQTSSLSLTTGWNFISFPKLPSNPTIASVFTDVSSNVRIIWGYDNSIKKWKRYKPEAIDNTLITIESGKGYWVYMNASGSIDTSSWITQSATVPLSLGWNLIGYNGTDDAEITGSLTSIGGYWTVIWTWQDGTWYAKHATETLTVPPVTTLKQDRAYWIKATGAVEWGQ